MGIWLTRIYVRVTDQLLRIPIIMKQEGGNYSACAPDFSCFSAGKSLEESRARMREALRISFEDMRADGQSLPLSCSLGESVTLNGLSIPILIEQGSHNYSASAPDLPGCAATGRSLTELRIQMREALRLHLQGMREDGEALPTAYSSIEILDISV